MKIKVIGKIHLEGIGKTSKRPYCFDQYHYNARSAGVEGVAAKQVNVDPAIISFASVIPGHEYDIEFDERGFCVDMRPSATPIK